MLIFNYFLTGTICKWYFARDKNNLESLVSTTFKQLIRFHLGSVCLGSMMITLVKIIRMLVSKLRNDAREGGNFLLLCIAGCLEYLLRMVDDFLKYLIRNAYIIVAKDGTPLIESGKKAFHLILHNLLDVIALNKFGDLVLAMARLFIVAISSIFAFYIMVRKFLKSFK